jgi:hypothetical protein
MRSCAAFTFVMTMICRLSDLSAVIVDGDA